MNENHTTTVGQWVPINLPIPDFLLNRWPRHNAILGRLRSDAYRSKLVDYRNCEEKSSIPGGIVHCMDGEEGPAVTLVETRKVPVWARKPPPGARWRCNVFADTAPEGNADYMSDRKSAAAEEGDEVVRAKPDLPSGWPTFLRNRPLVGLYIVARETPAPIPEWEQEPPWGAEWCGNVYADRPDTSGPGYVRARPQITSQAIQAIHDKRPMVGVYRVAKEGEPQMIGGSLPSPRMTGQERELARLESVHDRGGEPPGVGRDQETPASVEAAARERRDDIFRSMWE